MNTPSQFFNRILVVEDDELLAAGIVDNLRAEGHEVHTATDGQLALDWLGAEQCGLIVLDVMLPRVDGFTVCRTLRHPHGAVRCASRQCQQSFAVRLSTMSLLVSSAFLFSMSSAAAPANVL